MLKTKGRLLKTENLTHKYPYDWRTKKPVIIRATAQWFIDVHRIQETALQSLQDVTMVPPSGIPPSV